MKKYFTIILLCLNFVAYPQDKGDYQWLFGYNTGVPDSIYGGAIVNFNHNPILLSTENREMNFNMTNASICDDNGHLLFYTNGIYIANAEHEPMQNGTDLYVGDDLGYEATGLPLPQGAIILPMPNYPDLYVLFHSGIRIFGDSNTGLDVTSGPLMQTIVDMSGNGGLGTVIEKNMTVINDTLESGDITATKHANGRDWWIIVTKFDSNELYRVLLTPNGTINYGTQSIGEVVLSGLGQAVFSPDGTAYAHVSLINTTIGDFIHIYQFDRCSGEFSNPITSNYSFSARAGGVAISPNSRYLYLSSYQEIYQFDLLAEDILASEIRVAVYDGYQDGNLPTRFFLAQLAPDGKIYINCTNSVRVLHVIHNPDEAGNACNVEQHGVMLPTYNAFSMPNFPNYRLGALADSPCDTLISSTTALPTNTQHIQLYPNPAQYQVQLALATPFSKTVDVEIIDVLGNVVGRDILAAQVKELRLSLEGLVAGIYFISIKTPDGHILSRKLIISE